MAAGKTKGAAKRRPSGPSGANLKPGYLLRATQEEFEAWETEAVLRCKLPLSQWIRNVCNKAAGYEPKPKKRP